MMKKFRKGDDIVVLRGSNKKKTGKIIRFVNNDYVVVEGVAVKTFYKKTESDPLSKKVNKEGKIHISNISLLERGKMVKVKFASLGLKSDEIGFKKKARLSRVTNKEI